MKAFQSVAKVCFLILVFNSGVFAQEGLNDAQNLDPSIFGTLNTDIGSLAGATDDYTELFVHATGTATNLSEELVSWNVTTHIERHVGTFFGVEIWIPVYIFFADGNGTVHSSGGNVNPGQTISFDLGHYAYVPNTPGTYRVICTLNVGGSFKIQETAWAGAQ